MESAEGRPIIPSFRRFAMSYAPFRTPTAPSQQARLSPWPASANAHLCRAGTGRRSCHLLRTHLTLKHELKRCCPQAIVSGRKHRCGALAISSTTAGTIVFPKFRSARRFGGGAPLQLPACAAGVSTAMNTVSESAIITPLPPPLVATSQRRRCG